MGKKKIPVPEGAPRIGAIAAEARRERVKQYILGGKMSIEDMMAEEGVSRQEISNDIRHLKNRDILKEVKEGTRLAFLDYAADIQWSIDEAKRMHTEQINEDTGAGGRLDCLNFVAKTRKEEIEMAQKLGILDLIAEKKEHLVKFSPADEKLIKSFGDFLASGESDS